MKIGIIGHLKFPIAKPFAGGLEAFTHAFANALIQRGHEVSLFASADSDSRLPIKAIMPQATIPGSRSRFGRVDVDWVERTEDRSYARMMREIGTHRFDIVHNHSLSPIPLRDARLTGARLITTLHAPVLPRMAAEIRRAGAHSCGEFVNISQANARGWTSLLGSHRVIYNGVDTDLWRRRSGIKHNRSVWFGRIVPDKGVHLAIEASHRAGLAISVIGPVSDQDYFDHEVAPRLRTGDAYLGHQSHESLSRVIGRSAVAMVTPCWEEPFGLVVAESLACGTPVAAFCRGALPELISDRVGRLAEPDDVEELAQAATNCLPLDGGDCRRVAKDRFSFRRMVDQYERLYYQQLGEAA